MAISREFLELFEKFTKAYKTKGNPGYISGGDKHYQIILKTLENYLDSFKNHPAEFEDATIIGHVNNSLAITDKSANPNIGPLWDNLVTNYNKIKPLFFSLTEHASIKTGSEETSTAKMLEDLLDALKSTAKVHNKETQRLKARIEQLVSENEELSRTNAELQKQIVSRERLEALNPKIVIGQQKLQSVLELLDTLFEESKEINNQEQVIPAQPQAIVPVPPNPPSLDRAPSPIRETVSAETEAPAQPQPEPQIIHHTAPPPPGMLPKGPAIERQGKFFKSSGNFQTDITNGLKNLKKTKPNVEVETTDDEPEKKTVIS